VRQRLVMIGDRLVIDRRAHARRRLAARQLPQPAEQPGGRAAREHELAARLDPHQRARELGQLVRLLARRHHRQLALHAGARGRTARPERAREAARLAWGAQRRAELHQALIQVAGRGVLGERRHQRARMLPRRALARRRFDVGADREHAREHARHVAVDERRALAERDRRDRAGGVRPDPRHAAQLGRAARQLARDRARPRPQVARARVVAEARPRAEHVVERRRGERGHRREPLHPPRPVRDHGLHARLLQHHLADPDRVRVARSPPGQVAPHARVVRDDGFGECAGRQWYRCTISSTLGSNTRPYVVSVVTVVVPGPCSCLSLLIDSTGLSAVRLSCQWWVSQVVTARP
jgi:hypothetical protein